MDRRHEAARREHLAARGRAIPGRPGFLGSGPVGPPYTQEDFDRLRALGANYVNLSIPGLFTERPPYVLDDDMQSNLDDLLAMAEAADLFAVISFRTGPGRSDFTFYRDGAGDWFDPELLVEWVWEDQAAQDAWAEMWRHTAERYRDNPVVVGYDLMCEPNAPGIFFEIYEPSEFYPAYAGTLYDWNQFYPRLVEAIRAVDPDTPVLIGTGGWGATRWLPYLQPVDAPRIVYMIHQYEPQMQYTHQEPPAENTYPGEFDLDWDGAPDVFDRAWLADFLSIVGEFEAEYGAPVAVNEYGVKRWAPGADAFMADSMALFETHGMNHAFWVFNPAWPEYAGRVDDFDFLHGPDPDNHVSVETSDLIEVIRADWRQNEVYPSNALEALQ
ncbi:MAG: cellulase family glycosylhydrolase [Anaerolineae bacterium]|nr:cellulase family glycosylhydrolase [Anaerolineae bacterium]